MNFFKKILQQEPELPVSEQDQPTLEAQNQPIKDAEVTAAANQAENNQCEEIKMEQSVEAEDSTQVVQIINQIINQMINKIEDQAQVDAANQSVAFPQDDQESYNTQSEEDPINIQSYSLADLSESEVDLFSSISQTQGDLKDLFNERNNINDVNLRLLNTNYEDTQNGDLYSDFYYQTDGQQTAGAKPFGLFANLIMNTPKDDKTLTEQSETLISDQQSDSQELCQPLNQATDLSKQDTQALPEAELSGLAKPDDQSQSESNETSNQIQKADISPLQGGPFLTQRPIDLEEDYAEAVEDEIRQMIELHNEDNQEQFDQKLKQALEDYEDLEADLAYFKQIYSEVFGSQENIDAQMPNAVTAEQKLILAYESLNDARIRGSQIKFDDFKTISEYASHFDEEGVHITEADVFFYIDQSTGIIKNLKFDEMIRSQVHKLLKYRGCFRTFIRSKYFISPDQKNEFFFNASNKVPFYFIFDASPNIQGELMSQYLQNPVNAVMLIRYDQTVPYFHELDCTDVSVRRSVHLDHVYHNLKQGSPTLLCIGSPASGKSTMLNDIFAADFEVIEQGSIGLYHDSVDALFTCKDIPIGFNVLDFQGAFANRDFLLIQWLLEHVPQVYLFVQFTGLDFINSVLDKIDFSILKKFTNRVFFVKKQCKDTGKEKKTEQEKKIEQKNAFVQSKRKLKKLFPGFNEKQRLKEVDSTGYGPTYYGACQDIIEFIQQDIKSQKQEFKEELNALEQTMVADTKKRQKSPFEYKQIYGFFWLLSDSLERINVGNQLQLQTKDTRFRIAHMRTKIFLFNKTEETCLESLSRSKIFPMYIKELELKKIDQELKHRDRLDEASINEKEERKRLLKSLNPQHSELFRVYLKALLEEKQETVSDILELVESHYKRRITEDQEQIKRLKPKLEDIDSEIKSLKSLSKQASQKQNQVETNKLEERRNQISYQIRQLNQKVENRVLDSELFLRECKQYMLSRPPHEQKKFYDKITQNFEDGQAMEVVDGDIDCVENTSFSNVMEWVQKKMNNNNKLLVVTILGPQSSGKSTLLNYLVGAKFHVSAGRCTKGLNAMLIRTDFDETKEMLILDSEGIFSIERGDPKYDRRLAIFCMAVSNLLLINIKGEMSNNIKSVLQVAIYALKKIAQIESNLKKARIKFILRDQVETSSGKMDQAFGILKNSLRQAAQAAGAPLEQLIHIPERAEELISLFPAALKLEQINGNENYQQTQSSEIFRQRCSELRLELLNLAQSLPPESRILNLQEWGQSVTTIWTAIQENDDLVMIQDLEQINNHRKLVTTIEIFRKMMSKAAPIGEEDIKHLANPLLPGTVPENLRDQQIVKENQTIFALFDEKINALLIEQQNRDKTVSLDHFIEDKRKELKQQHTVFEEQYLQQATYYAENMGPELQYQAQNSVRNIILQIWQKSMNKWQDSQATAVISDSLGEMHQKLNSLVHQVKLSNQTFTLDQFQEKMKEQSTKTRNNIRKHFFKSPEEIWKGAMLYFKEIAQRTIAAQNVSEENMAPQSSIVNTFNILSTNAKCLHNKSVNMTELEKGSISDEEVKVDIKGWCRPDSIKLRVAIENYIKLNVKEHTDLQDQVYLLQAQIKDHEEQKNQKDEVKEVQLQAMKANVKKHLETNCDLLMFDLCVKIESQMLQRWTDLRESILKVRDQIKVSNQNVSKPQDLPEEFVDKIIEVYNSEISRQNQDAQVRQYPRDLKELHTCIKYEQQNYIDAFNQILFNLILEQSQRNDQLKMSVIDVQIKKTEDESLQFYRNLNEKVSSDSEAAIGFQNVVINRLAFLLQQEVVQQFTQKMYSIDSEFGKKELQKAVNCKFIDAQDYETIISHMKTPLELENQVLRQMYFMKQKDYVEEMKSTYAKYMKNALNCCQNFTQKIVRELDESKGDQKENMPTSELTSLIQYIYGSIFKQIAGEQVNAFLAKREVLDGFGLFPKSYHLPENEVGVFQVTSSDRAKSFVQPKQYENQHFIDDSLLLETQAVGVKNIRFFAKLLRFDDQALLKNLDKELSKQLKGAENTNYAAVEKIIGCKAVCWFCGARCEAELSCEENKQEHNTKFHRPMAFMGTHEREEQSEDGKKKLLKDFCTSNYNMKHSLWPKPDSKKTELQNLLQRLADDFQLTTSGINVCLEWESGSDLDLQIMCACGKWHGYGTTGGSFGRIKCVKCDMFRDHDVSIGDDGRKAIEHVYFKSTEKIYGKEIGVGVFNYAQESEYPDNRFTLSIMNRYGYQLFPDKGAETVERKDWMVIENVSKRGCRQHSILFTEEDDKLGRDALGNDFKSHADIVAESKGGGKWLFNENLVQQDANDVHYKAYRQSWDEKWQIVKDILCGPEHYDSDLLDKVFDV